MWRASPEGADSNSRESRAEHAQISPPGLGQPRSRGDALYRVEGNIDAALHTEQLAPAQYFKVEILSVDR